MHLSNVALQAAKVIINMDAIRKNAFKGRRRPNGDKVVIPRLVADAFLDSVLKMSASSDPRDKDLKAYGTLVGDRSNIC